MQITLNITEDSKVELVKDNCELVQGECCFTDFVFNFPETIKGHAISEYAKSIEFAECKEIGECVKFVDEIKDNKYELNEACTAFKKIMVQVVLERVADGKTIVWKTIPFTLEFAESINAEGMPIIQAQLLSLADIKNSWETFVKTSCLRMVYSSAGVPLANEESEGDTIFYLGDNNGDFEYGHYYRCTEIDGLCSWKDLTQDPSLEGVANGIREINKNRTMQLWTGTFEELEATPPQGENVLVIPEDADAVQEMKEILSEIAGANEGNFVIPRVDENGVFRAGDVIIPQKKLLWKNGDNGISYFMAGSDTTVDLYEGEESLIGRTFEIIIQGAGAYKFKFHANQPTIRCLFDVSKIQNSLVVYTFVATTGYRSDLSYSYHKNLGVCVEATIYGDNVDIDRECRPLALYEIIE